MSLSAELLLAQTRNSEEAKLFALWHMNDASLGLAFKFAKSPKHCVQTKAFSPLLLKNSESAVVMVI